MAVLVSIVWGHKRQRRRYGSTHRLCNRGRPYQARLGREPEPARWQYDGVYMFQNVLEAKRLGLLRDVFQGHTIAY